MNLQIWRDYIDDLTYTPLFVTISGAHIYGFPSADSDIDLRGCHLLPLPDVVGLSMPDETFQKEEFHNGIEVDLVSHELGKYFRLLVKNNGYVMEQIFSPLVVTGQAFLDQLRPLAKKCLTRNHYFHYRGFYNKQRELIEKKPLKTAKSVLYAYRVLLTGTHLLETGEIESDLRILNQTYNVPDINELISSKISEQATVDIDWNIHARRFDELAGKMENAFDRSQLPERPDTNPVNDLLVRIRLGQ